MLFTGPPRAAGWWPAVRFWVVRNAAAADSVGKGKGGRRLRDAAAWYVFQVYSLACCSRARRERRVGLSAVRLWVVGGVAA